MSFVLFLLKQVYINHRSYLNFYKTFNILRKARLFVRLSGNRTLPKLLMLKGQISIKLGRGGVQGQGEDSG